jgi:hypothetical protein
LLDVFTHTSPGPPPGAAVFAAAAAAGPCFFAAIGAGAAAIGAAAEGAAIAGAGFAIGVGAGIAAAFEVAATGAPFDAADAGAAAYHVCTPLCPRHAPLFEAAVEYVPSLQIPFEPAGAPAGACAIAPAAPIARTPIIINIRFVIATTLENLQN